MIAEFDLMIDYGQILIQLSTVARPRSAVGRRPRRAGLRLSAGHRQLRRAQLSRRLPGAG
jgi:hypothetical protein